MYEHIFDPLPFLMPFRDEGPYATAFSTPKTNALNSKLIEYPDNIRSVPSIYKKQAKKMFAKQKLMVLTESPCKHEMENAVGTKIRRVSQKGSS